MSQAAVNAIAEEIGDLLTVSEAAGVARCSVVTIYRAVDDGLIEGVIRLGGKRGMRIPVASFRKFLESRRVTGQLVPADATAA